MRILSIAIVSFVLFFLRLDFACAQNETSTSLSSLNVVRDSSWSSLFEELYIDEHLMIELWSPACQICNIKLNTISEEYDTWKKRTGLDIVVVVPERANRDALRFFTLNNWPFEIFFDPDNHIYDELSKSKSKPNLPTSYIVNREYDVLGVMSTAEILKRDSVKDVYTDPEVLFLPSSIEILSLNEYIMDLSSFYSRIERLN